MKRLVTITIVCVCLVMLAACGGGGLTVSRTSYKVITSDESGAPVEGVAVQFCNDNLCLKTDTDEDGVAEFKTEEGAYTVHILGVPEGYAEDDTVYPAPEKYGDVNITIKKAE